MSCREALEKIVKLRPTYSAPPMTVGHRDPWATAGVEAVKLAEEAIADRKISVHFIPAITFVEDRNGYQGVYLDGELVLEIEVLDWLDLLDALEKHPSVKVERLAFMDREVEQWPRFLDEVLMWQLN